MDSGGKGGSFAPLDPPLMSIVRWIETLFTHRITGLRSKVVLTRGRVLTSGCGQMSRDGSGPVGGAGAGLERVHWNVLSGLERPHWNIGTGTSPLERGVTFRATVPAYVRTCTSVSSIVLCVRRL